MDSELESVRGQEIFEILVDHVVDFENTPPEFTQDLVELAEYYQRFPEVVSLFRSLANLSWGLRYLPETFNTQVNGTVLQINHLEVQFDTRTAVKQKFHNACRLPEKRPHCIASPADALLHEFLHAKSILFDPKGFIADGGMSSVFYPFEHERKTIAAENKLYKAMTSIDGLSRPLRTEHSGRPVSVGCVTCLVDE